MPSDKELRTMDTCYLGESFELKYKVEKGPISSASFKVYGPDGTIQDQGLMGIDDKVISFRFTAETVGMHTIDVTWVTGQDVWRTPFLMDVKP